MYQVNIYEAKTQLSRLLERVEAGEDVVIARAGRPVARLVRVGRERPRTAGGWKGRWWLADDWDSDELNLELAADFERGSAFPSAPGSS
jgi:prevent-host-death family protein